MTYRQTTLVFSEKAIDDLGTIWKYIARDNISAADSFHKKLYEHCIQISKFSEIGRKRDELFPNLRSLVVGNYLIFFLKRVDQVEIVRILHGSMDFQNYFQQTRTDII